MMKNPWNLNVLPVANGSVLVHAGTDISGMVCSFCATMLKLGFQLFFVSTTDGAMALCRHGFHVILLAQ